MRFTKRTQFLCAVAVLYAPTAYAQTAAEAVSDASDAEIRDIVVTARRNSESIQTVPVSVTAFSGETLAEKTILNTRDLTFATPGVTFTSSGASYNVNLTIRGQSRAVTGAGLPSVLTYFNEVPLPNNGSNIPTFDLSSVQVLKGPQGTFFGRNTTGGLVLTYSQAPVYELGGYVEAAYGNYDDRRVEGAINIPIVDGKVAVRVAGQLMRHDGYTRNMSGGPDFDDLHRDALRVSFRIDPTENFSSVTVFDYALTTNTGASSTPVARNIPAPGMLSPALIPFFNCGTAASCDADLALERAQTLGPRRQWTNLARPFERVKNWGVSNTTTLDLGNVSIKNIFGYRNALIDVLLDVDGTDLRLVTVRRAEIVEQWTDEVQIYGTLFQDRLDWRIGGFYLNSKPNGNNDVVQSTFEMPLSVYNDGHNYYTDTSKAIFGTLSYDFGNLVSGLKLNVGGRYTIDKQKVCSITTRTTSNTAFSRLSPGECRNSATAFQSSVESKEPTYTIGIDYQLNDNIFLYVTKRRGYRGGGINSPQFSATAPNSLAPYQGYNPEFINDYEAGIKTTWRTGGMSGRFNLSAYTGTFKNIQGTIVLPANFDGDGNAANDPTNTALTINRGAATIKGIDVLAMISPVRGLAFTVAAAYTDAKYTDTSLPAAFRAPGVGGNEAVFSGTPEWTTTVNGRYELPLGDGIGELVANVDYYYSSKVNFQTLVAPGYDIVNARLDWNNVLASGVDLAVFGRNLFDKNYVQGGNLSTRSLDLLAAHYGDPRTYGVQARFRF